MTHAIVTHRRSFYADDIIGHAIVNTLDDVVAFVNEVAATHCGKCDPDSPMISCNVPDRPTLLGTFNVTDIDDGRTDLDDVIRGYVFEV